MKDLLAGVANLFTIILAEKWKAATATLIGVVMLAGALVWTERDVLINRLFADRSDDVVLDVEFVAAHSHKWIIDTNSNAWLLWGVDMGKNQRTFLYADTLRLGRITTFDGSKSTVFTKVKEENELFLRLLNGEVVCAALFTTSAVGVTLQKNGVTYLCRGPIPSRDGTLLGYITIGFKEQPSAADEETVSIQLKSMSKQIIDASYAKRG